jgi:hypothetical protein
MPKKIMADMTEESKPMSDANTLRFYIDQAIMARDYAALAVFEDRLAVLETSRTDDTAEAHRDPPLSEAPVWTPK